jgi:hypothetical protein
MPRVLRSMVPSLIVWRSPVVYSQTVSVVSVANVISSFQPRVMDGSASENTCAELCALPILRMYMVFLRLAIAGTTVGTMNGVQTLLGIGLA